jgi:hypothetical protein
MGDVQYRARNMEITCYLEKGKKYTITGGVKDDLWGINLLEGRVKAVVGSSYLGTTFLEFIPFKHQPDTFVPTLW